VADLKMQLVGGAEGCATNRIWQNGPSRIRMWQTPSDRYFEALVLIPLCSTHAQK